MTRSNVPQVTTTPLIRRALVNLAFVVLTFSSVVIALSSVREAGISNWYLFFSPLLLAASFYGVKGALITGAAVFAALSLIYQNTLSGYPENLASAQEAMESMQLAKLIVYARTLSDDYSQALFGTLLMFAGAVGIGYLTDQRQSMARRLAYLADHDMLTGLLNRRRFVYELESQVARALRNNYTTSLLFIDLDGFKTINDTLGHMAGDLVLQGVSRALENNTRAFDVPARVGGDEFAVILPQADDEHAKAAASRIAEGIRQSHIEFEGRLYGVTASIGIAMCPQDAPDANLLLMVADTAMYQAKARGKNLLSLYQQMAHPMIQPGSADIASPAANKPG